MDGKDRFLRDPLQESEVHVGNTGRARLRLSRFIVATFTGDKFLAGCPAWSGTVHSANGHGRSRAVAVGFEPTNGLPRYTLSSSANPHSGTAARVRHVLNTPVRGCHRTPADDNE